ncbi:MAG: hypothetical protein IT340_00640 [Chloroflexi bacterium]|nr:hypothetical protein [Chloroflexota bacterium]
MPWSRNTMMAIFGLIGLAALALVALLARGDMVLGSLVSVALLGGALAVAVVKRRQMAAPGVGYRPDLDRLRPGRLRDGCIHVAGYHRQLEALAETLPQPAQRAALRADLPLADAALRAVYDLCIGLQAYELGESQPGGIRPAGTDGADPLVAEAEGALQATLDTFSQIYGALRQSWSAAALSDTDGRPLTALEPHTAHLRDLAAAFAPSRTLRSVARGEA